MFNIFHICGLVLAAYLIYDVGRRPDSAYKGNLMMVCVCSFVTMTGRIIFTMSYSYDALIAGGKVEYMGKCFASFFSIVFILQYREINWNKWILRAMLLINLAGFGIILSCEYHKLYYTKITLIEDGNDRYMQLDKGPVYIIYMLFMLGEMITYMVLAVTPLIKNKKRKLLNSDNISNYMLLALSGVTPFLLLILQLAKIFGTYDVMPISMLVSNLLFVMAVDYHGLLNVVQHAKDNIVENIDTGIFVTDNSANILYANPEAKFIYDTYSDNKESNILDVEKLNKYRGKVMSLGERQYEVQKSVIGDENGSSGYIYSLVDVTATVARARQMEELKNQAEEANKAKSIFLSNVSHEIRTPINVIIGMNELILRENKDENIQEYADGIEKASHILLSLISDVLDLSKVESGKIQFDNKDFSVAEFIKDAYEITKLRAVEKGLEFICVADAKMPACLKGDAKYLRQIYMNLLVNAIKYTEKGYVKTEFAYENGNLVIKVADTGCGIKEEDLTDIFNRFTRFEAEKNAKVEGAGLGLNITSRIAEQMGGRISIESEYGKGTEFTVIIPVEKSGDEKLGELNLENNKKKQALMESKETTKGIQEQLEEFTAPDANVLVVDDNEMNRKVLKGLLKKTLIKVDTAESGTEAINMCIDKKYDLILMDHMMPEMNGIDAMHRIREIMAEKEYSAPILVLTANAISGMREMYLEAGFDDYITKPVEWRKLEKTLAYYLKSSM